MANFIEVSPESFPSDSHKLISLAKNNTLYINDVALLSDEAQALLQHLLESGRLKECQLICATQLGLDKFIARGDFSEGLFYQLNTITLQLPALRDHVEDIPELVHFFVDQQTTQADLPYRRFTVAAQNRLRNYALARQCARTEKCYTATFWCWATRMILTSMMWKPHCSQSSHLKRMMSPVSILISLYAKHGEQF